MADIDFGSSCDAKKANDGSEKIRNSTFQSTFHFRIQNMMPKFFYNLSNLLVVLQFHVREALCIVI